MLYNKKKLTPIQEVQKGGKTTCEPEEMAARRHEE